MFVFLTPNKFHLLDSVVTVTSVLYSLGFVAKQLKIMLFINVDLIQ